MQISPKEFRQELTNRFLDLLWKQWSALGVASHVSEEKQIAIDVEALAVSTLGAGFVDPRLLSVSTEWLLIHDQWVNAARMKRIGRFYSASPWNPVPPSLTFESIEWLKSVLSRFDKKPLLVQPESKEHSLDLEKQVLAELREFQPRGKIASLEIRKSVLCQLFLRALFGINARPEIYLYLLWRQSGNSRQIGRETYYDQKAVYRILERWVAAGLLVKQPDPARGNYSVRNAREWNDLLGSLRLPLFVNWTRLFQILVTLVRLLHTPPWSDDDYLLSSWFRDIHGDLCSLAVGLDIIIPEPSSYRGADYFSPMAEALLGLIHVLLDPVTERPIH